MEILAYNNSPGGYVVSLQRKSVCKGLQFCRLKPLALQKPKIFYAAICLRSNMFLRNRDGRESLKSFALCKRLKRGGLKVLSGNYNSYVVGEEEGVEGVPETGEPATKILIPGLPDESSGKCGAPLSSCFWEWKPKLSVHYEKAGWENVKYPPVLLLPGFGVGSFHYEKQLKDLGSDYRVWAIDFLGQGLSLPTENPTVLSNEQDAEGNNSLWGFGDEAEPWASNLVFSIDLWGDQVRSFVEEVIGEPVYVVGNSLGGFVALYFAASNPQLVKGVTLLNATPFWGFLPNPIRFQRFAKLLPWSGTFPLPSRVKKLLKFLWQKISDPQNITEVLKQVYADHSTKIDKVVSRILEITQHPAAAASFASIMLAPQGQLSFKESLSMCKKNNVQICLMYGKEDPWVKPVWGLQVKRQVPEAPYYEISPAGHCPHDEVPEVVNYLLRGWIKNLESGGCITLPLLEEAESSGTSFARELEFVREGSRKSVRVRYYGPRFMLWSSISSWIKTKIGRLEETTA